MSDWNIYYRDKNLWLIRNCGIGFVGVDLNIFFTSLLIEQINFKFNFRKVVRMLGWAKIFMMIKDIPK